MADVSDVLTALRDLVVHVLYPNGPPSILGYAVKVYAGWPDPDTLDADMAQAAAQSPVNIAHVSLYPRPAERNTTRYPTDWQDLSTQATTFTLTQTNQSVTVGGSNPSPFYTQNLTITLAGNLYLAQTDANSTAASIAQAFYDQMATTYPVTISGPVLTMPNWTPIAGLAVGAGGVSIKEVRRQEREIQVSAWCPSPAVRDALIKAIDPVLANTPFLTLADGTAARLTYKGSPVTDFDQKQAIFRRDLIFTVEYATTLTQATTQIVAPVASEPAGYVETLIFLTDENGAPLTDENGAWIDNADTRPSTGSVDLEPG